MKFPDSRSSAKYVMNFIVRSACQKEKKNLKRFRVQDAKIPSNLNSKRAKELHFTLLSSVALGLIASLLTQKKMQKLIF